MMKKKNIKFMLKLIQNFCKANGFNDDGDCDSCCINYHNCNKSDWDKIDKDLVKYKINR